ncbi:MAG: FAD-dependent oxidoreductase [Defluviitaleaceae bacterium]|nr:FAD-dependent oxidoreductase [Defluviitaleaceae bacterium]
MRYYTEPERKIPAREYDAVIAGGGTGGVLAAVAAARNGAKTALIESKGYAGGIVTEGGTAIHSFFNLWKAFPGVEKRQVVRGIPQEIVDRLAEYGGTTGHAEMTVGYDYDSICTAVDTEVYKHVCFEILRESGVDIFVNTMLVGAAVEGKAVGCAIMESRAGREAFFAKSFVDATGYGDLCAHAGAEYTEPNDYPVANGMGVGGVDVEKYHKWFAESGALTQYSEGLRDGRPGKIVRVDGDFRKVSREFAEEAAKIGMSPVITTTRDDYFMFVKINYVMQSSPTGRDALTQAEIELRRRQMKAVELLRRYVPGCEGAFIARTSPSVAIRRGRCVACDFDIPHEDILNGVHYEDDVFTYGFHDSAPRFQIKNGGTYGIPYRALCVRGFDNLYAIGMMITSDHDAHMSTRNTVACMGQGQAAGTAAALCAQSGVGVRELEYKVLREALVKGGVYLE